MTDKIVVFSTCGSEEEAQRIAQAVVSKRLAACATLLPRMESLYWWNGKVERSQEFLLIIKSSRTNFSRLQAEISRMHSYQTPEVVALSIVDGAPDYLDWMDREMAPPPSPPTSS